MKTATETNLADATLAGATLAAASTDPLGVSFSEALDGYYAFRATFTVAVLVWTPALNTYGNATLVAAEHAHAKALEAAFYAAAYGA